MTEVKEALDYALEKHLRLDLNPTKFMECLNKFGEATLLAMSSVSMIFTFRKAKYYVYFHNRGKNEKTWYELEKL